MDTFTGVRLVLYLTSSIISASETITCSPSRFLRVIGTLWTTYWDHSWRGPRLVSLSDSVAFCLISLERSCSEALAEAARAAKPVRVRVIALKMLSWVPVAAQKARRNSHGVAFFRAASCWTEKKILLSARGARTGAFFAAGWGWGVRVGVAATCA
jgi:hypothetical protein